MSSKNGLRLFSLFILPLLSAACSHMDFGTMWKYRNVDFMEVNPDTARVAIHLPKAIHIEDIRFTVTGTRDEVPVFSSDISLDLIRTGPEMNALPPKLIREQTIVLRIPRDQLAEVRDLQLKAHQLATEPGHNGLGVGFNLQTEQAGEKIAPTLCTAADPFPSMSVWIKLEEGENYARLIGEKAFKRILAESVSQSMCDSTGD